MKSDKLIRILLVGRTTDDPSLPITILENAGLRTENQVVDDLESLRLALNLTWDAVLFHRRSSGLSVDAVVEALRKSNLRAPLILVGQENSGETFAQVLENGCADYTSLSDLGHILPGILQKQNDKAQQGQSQDDPTSHGPWAQGYLLAVEHSCDAIYLIQDDRIQFANRRTIENSGYSLSELVSKPISEFIHPEEQPKFKERCAHVLEGAVPRDATFVTRIFRKSSGYGWTSYNCATVSWRGRPAALVFMRAASDRGINEYCQRLCTERFVQFMSQLPVAANIKDPSGRFVFLNEYARNTMGLPIDDLVGHHYTDVSRLSQDTYHEIDEIDSRVFQTGVPFRGVLKYIVGGQPKYFSTVKFPLSDKQGPTLIGSVLMDITEQTNMESAFRASEKRYRDLFENMTEALSVLQPIRNEQGQIVEFVIVDSNPASAKIAGKPVEQYIGRPISVEFEGVEKTDKFRLYAEVANSGIPRKIVQKAFMTDTLLESTIYPTGDGHVAVLSKDITLFRKAEEEIRKAFSYTRGLIEASLDPLVTISEQGKITDVNKATEVVTGFPREELIGSDFCDYFAEPEKAREGYKKVLHDGMVTDYPLTIKHVSGRTTDVHYNATVYSDENGRLQGVFAAARDITERKKAETEVRRASLYARSLIEASLDPLVTISEAGKITDVNRATETATGLPREQLIGNDFSNYFTEPEKARQGYKKVLHEGSVTDYPLTIKHVSGRMIDVLYNATIYGDETGRLQGVFAAARDVTERNRAEEKAKRLARVLSVLSAINETIVRVRDMDRLFAEACRIAVALGGLRMAWVGLIDEASGLLRVVASAGVVDGYLDNVQISARDDVTGRGPTGRCVREKRHSVCVDFQTDPRMAPWREEAARRGYRSSAAFPLKSGGKVVGTFTLYSGEIGFFNDDEVQVLLELSDDISLAVEFFDQEAARKRAEEQIRIDADRYATMLATVPDGFWRCDTYGRLLDVNDAYCRLSGYSQEELLKMNIQDLEALETAAEVGEHIRKIVADGFDRFESSHRRKDGSIVDVEISASFWHETGQFLLFIRDITERLQSERALNETLQRLESQQRLLEDKNIALREVLTQLESEKNSIRKRFTTNVEQAILPSLIRLSESTRGPQRRELELLIREVNEIVSPFIDSLKSRFASLSSREVEVCRMIRAGLTSKEIAENLNIAPATVQKYRELIRKKLNLTNDDINLRTFLESLSS